MEISVNVVSVQEIYSKKNQATYYRCYIILPDGSVGSVFAMYPHKTGDKVLLVLALNRDGSIGVRIKER